MWRKSDFAIAISMKNCTYTLAFIKNKGVLLPPKNLWKLLDAKVLNVATKRLHHRNQREKLYLWGGFRENLGGPKEILKKGMASGGAIFECGENLNLPSQSA